MADDWKVRISGYLDGELNAAERKTFEQQIDRDPELARELEAMRAMKEVTGSMKLTEFPDTVWDRYWEGTYNRLERGIGWILLSLGAIVLVGFGLYEFAVSLLKDAGEPWWIRAAVGSVSVGLAILFISVLRERIFVRKRDPYREVKR